MNFTIAGGLNAWQITDDNSQSGSTFSYSTNLTDPQHQAATNSGWRLTINSRLTTDFGGDPTMNFGYGTGPGRFLVWLDLDTAGNLIANLDGVTTIPLTTGGRGAERYHTNEIRYTNGSATYFFDGTPKATWQGTSFDLPAGRVFWGAGSSSGRGQMNFHQVRFETLGVVASYDAGSAGNPPEPPDPVASGWTNIAGAIPLSAHSIAPDGEPFVPAVETLSASDITLSTAQLNGEVNPHGSATAAWFEWGPTITYGNKTLPRNMGASQIDTNLNAQIGPLSSAGEYHFRLVASNSFGLRFGNDQVLHTPSFELTGNLPNAWRITDNSTASGSTLFYATNLTLAQRSAASNSWRFTITSRLVTDFGADQTMIFGYGNGTKRYSVWSDFDVKTNLTALLDGQTVPIIVVSNAAGETLYHTHELTYTNQEATYRVDGTEIARWPGLTTTANANQVFWGAGAQGGKGQMNFQRVEFQVGGSNVVAIYDAGTQGNPGPAPTNRWTRIGGPVVVGSNLTEQVEVFLPTVETLAATAIGSTSAQLNGRVTSHGRQTAAWFEWGVRTSYGNRTPVPQNAGSGFGAVDINNILSGLEVDTTYHFRIVASNSVVTAFGNDQSFRTTWFADAAVNLPSMSAGSTAWGDYDHDGDLDLLLTGQTDSGDVSRIYRNEGGGSFAQVSTALIGVYQGSAAWGDYDRDGDLDILLSGRSSIGPISRVYRNDRTNFTAINAGLPGLFMSSVAWVDCDNDGDLDIFLTGADVATNRFAGIYRNDSSGGAPASFVSINAGFAGKSEGAVTSGDFDGDGDHDFIITGLDSSGTPSTHYYRNDGAGVFTGLDLNLPGIHSGSIAPADYDNDGNLDLLLSGSSSEGEITRLFRNIRNGPAVEFEEVQTILANLSSGSVVWGDFDNDGDPDVAQSGWTGGPFSAIYRNDGQGIFVPLPQDIAGVFGGSTSWGDLDNDGDLDLLLAGRNDDGSAFSHALHVYWNLSPVANTAPTTPLGLTGSGEGDSATVTWKPATDDQTLLSALTYNLVLSSVTNGIDLASPMANTTNGYRRVAQFGGAGHNHSWTFSGLNPGTYYFSVQAIDSAYAGGPFAPWHAVEVAPFPVAIIASETPQAGQFRIHFVGTPGGAYQVQRSIDLSTWTTRGTGIETSSTLFEFTDTNVPATGAFYRIHSSTP